MCIWVDVAIPKAHPGWAVLQHRTQDRARMQDVTPKFVQSLWCVTCQIHPGNQLGQHLFGDPKQCLPVWGTRSLRFLGIPSNVPLSGTRIPLDSEQHRQHCLDFLLSSSLSAKLCFCPGNTPVMHSFCWWARIRRTLHKAVWLSGYYQRKT